MHLYFGDKVGLEVAQSVLVDAAFVVPADFGIDAANGQVHPAQAPLCVPVHVLARIDIAGPRSRRSRMRASRKSLKEWSA